MKRSFQGLFAATLTPMHADASLAIENVPGMVEFLIAQGVDGLYVCGSTGEGPSLTREERMAVAEAYIQAADGRVPVLVQVGQVGHRIPVLTPAHRIFGRSLGLAARLGTWACWIGVEIATDTSGCADQAAS